jgi:hypothetical protein
MIPAMMPRAIGLEIDGRKMALLLTLPGAGFWRSAFIGRERSKEGVLF